MLLVTDPTDRPSGLHIKMSEYGLDNESPPQQQQQQQFGGEATHNLSTDDPTNAADNVSTVQHNNLIYYVF